jgi:hypothetical protein
MNQLAQVIWNDICCYSKQKGGMKALAARRIVAKDNKTTMYTMYTMEELGNMIKSLELKKNESIFVRLPYISQGKMLKFAEKYVMKHINKKEIVIISDRYSKTTLLEIF